MVIFCNLIHAEARCLPLCLSLSRPLLQEWSARERAEQSWLRRRTKCTKKKKKKKQEASKEQNSCTQTRYLNAGSSSANRNHPLCFEILAMQMHRRRPLSGPPVEMKPAASRRPLPLQLRWCRQTGRQAGCLSAASALAQTQRAGRLQSTLLAHRTAHSHASWCAQTFLAEPASIIVTAAADVESGARRKQIRQ